MKELRCLVFNDQEVVSAVIDRRRKRREEIPKGAVMGVTFQDVPVRSGGLEASIHVTDDLGDDRVITIDETEMTAALVNHCMARKVPLPVESDKSVFLIKGTATLIITMNFNRPPRLITAPTRPEPVDEYLIEEPVVPKGPVPRRPSRM